MIGFWRRLVAWRARHKVPFPEGFSMLLLFLVLGGSAAEATWWSGMVAKHLLPVMESFNQYGTWHNLPLYILALLILGSAGLEALVFGYIADEARCEIFRRWRLK